MIATLTKMWQEYDKLAIKWGMYKVETIGDAYVGVIGCPERRNDHAERAVEFALEIIDMIKSFKTAMDTSIQIRIGLASGSITAGVLGDQNPHWCVLGDPVQLANKMESTSKHMQIHINENTYNLLKLKTKYAFEGPEIVNFKVGQTSHNSAPNKTIIYFQGKQLPTYFVTKK